MGEQPLVSQRKSCISSVPCSANNKPSSKASRVAEKMYNSFDPPWSKVLADQPTAGAWMSAYS